MRNQLLFAFVLLSLTHTAKAQCNDKEYTRIFNEAHALQEEGMFIESKNRYEAAKIYACSQKEKDSTDEEVDKIFEQINQLRQSEQLERQRADIAKSRSDSLYNLADKERKRAEAALDKIYFYQDRFGLAFKKDSSGLASKNDSNKFGFIDKNSKTKIEYKYIEARSFDPQGLAQVSKDLPALITGDLDGKNLVQYLIDTLGTEYPLELRKGRLGRETKAADFSYSKYFMIPIKVTQQEQLRVLRINHSKIIRIPKRIGNLKSLHYVQLKNNRIKKIHDNIGNLKNLESLELSGNRLKKLPKGIGGLMSLKVLNLNDNNIIALPDEIGDLTNLQWLSLRSNRLRDLPEGISNLHNLKMLDLRYNTIVSLPEKVIEMNHLTIDLRKTQCGIKYIEFLKNKMQGCTIISDYK